MDSRLRIGLLIVAVLATVIVSSTAAFGQCSMCRAALTGSNNAFFIRNFNVGVLVLLVPPVAIFCSIFVALKRHHAGNDQQEPEKDSSCSTIERP